MVYLIFSCDGCTYSVGRSAGLDLAESERDIGSSSGDDSLAAFAIAESRSFDNTLLA